jgi:hypothetical protein
MTAFGFVDAPVPASSAVVQETAAAGSSAASAPATTAAASSDKVLSGTAAADAATDVVRVAPSADDENINSAVAEAVTAAPLVTQVQHEMFVKTMVLHFYTKNTFVLLDVCLIFAIIRCERVWRKRGGAVDLLTRMLWITTREMSMILFHHRIV